MELTASVATCADGKVARLKERRTTRAISASTKKNVHQTEHIEGAMRDTKRPCTVTDPGRVTQSNS